MKQAKVLSPQRSQIEDDLKQKEIVHLQKQLEVTEIELKQANRRADETKAQNAELKDLLREAKKNAPRKQAMTPTNEEADFEEEPQRVQEE